MKDLIERQVAIELIHSLYPSAPIMRINRKRWEKKYKPYIEAEKALEQLPSAQPEKIKCYECKHGTHSGCGNVYICNVSPELVTEHTGDFYCGYAKRKTDGEVD